MLFKQKKHEDCIQLIAHKKYFEQFHRKYIISRKQTLFWILVFVLENKYILYSLINARQVYIICGTDIDE